jgi:hypothetical protein
VALSVIVLSNIALSAAVAVAPFFYSLKGFGYLIGIYLAYTAAKIHTILDLKTILINSFKIIWLYFVPAVVLGIVMIFTIRFREDNIFLFIGILIVGMTAIFLRTNFLPQIFSRRTNGIMIGYDKFLETKLVDLEYNLSTENFGNQVSQILCEEVKCDGINILISNGEEFVSVYKGTVFNEEHSRKSQQNYDSL